MSEAKKAIEIMRKIKDKVYNILNCDEPEKAVHDVMEDIDKIIDRIEEESEAEDE